jgi:hypothetical protein
MRDLYFNQIAYSPDSRSPTRLHERGSGWIRKRFSCILEFLNILEISQNASSLSLSKFKLIVNNQIRKEFICSWFNNKEKKNSSGKLDSYIKLKSNFQYEEYLTLLNNFNFRRGITRLKISSHRLRIETGRYVGLERNNRICEKCHMNVVENEIHFLIDCPFYKENRIKLLNEVQKHNVNFNNLDSSQKYFWIVTCENIDILLQLGNFLSNYLM